MELAKKNKANWVKWESKLPSKIKPIKIFILLIITFITYSPILTSDFLWNDYDQSARSTFKISDPWITSFSLEKLYNGIDNPISLLTFYIEQHTPLRHEFTHRLINIFLHFIICVLVYKILIHIKLSGAFISTLLFCIHPLCVQTLFWPGYRANIIIFLLILLSLNFALSENNKQNLLYAIFLSGITSLISPLAIIIPLCLILFEFILKEKLSIKNFNKHLPILITVFLITICSVVIHKNNYPILSQDINGFFLLEKLNLSLKCIFLPDENAFFIPLNIDSEIFRLFKSELLVVTIVPFLLLICLFLRDKIFSRFMITGLIISSTLVLYSINQNGYFLDKTIAIDEHSLYMALLPCVALITGTVHSIISYKLNKLKVIRIFLYTILISLLLLNTYERSSKLSSQLTMWKYFNDKWPKSIVPQKALSDYFHKYDTRGQNLKLHINIIESIRKNKPNDVEIAIRLARLYAKAKQTNNATNLYKKIVSLSNYDNIQILEEAAIYFETQNLDWESKKTRSLIKEIEK